jgi:hypothetical protein
MHLPPVKDFIAKKISKINISNRIDKRDQGELAHTGCQEFATRTKSIQLSNSINIGSKVSVHLQAVEDMHRHKRIQKYKSATGLKSAINLNLHLQSN